MLQKKHAFTLIELLTVIAIIGILAAILIPVVGKVRESARAAKCVSQLRSTTTAMISHINENDGILYTMVGGSGTTGWLWTAKLAEEGYFEGPRGNPRAVQESVLCPDGVFRDPGHNWDAFGLNIFDPNGNDAGRDPTGATTLYVRNFNDATITASRYILMADSIRGDLRQVFRLAQNRSNDSGSIAMRHNGNANIGFLDGHVETVSPQRIRTFEPEMISGRDNEGNDVEFPDPKA